VLVVVKHNPHLVKFLGVAELVDLALVVADAASVAAGNRLAYIVVKPCALMPGGSASVKPRGNWLGALPRP
jgi:hypothetical protein